MGREKNDVYSTNIVCIKREVTSLPLSQSVISKLIASGFRFVQDIKSLRCLELANELQCDTVIAVEILKACTDQTYLLPLSFSALDAVQHSSLTRPIISFCKQLDKALGGGIPCGQITEIVGLPGAGKTQVEESRMST